MNEMKISKKMQTVIYDAIVRADDEWARYMDAVHLVRGCKTSDEIKSYLIKRGFGHLVGLPRSNHTQKYVINALEQYRKPKGGAR
jgi:hypothetical protein